MTTPNLDTVVISVGGSLIVPDQIDTDFLANLKALITSETAAGRSFIIICGGAGSHAATKKRLRRWLHLMLKILIG